MRKATKITLIVATVLIVLGFVLGFIGVAGMDFDFSRLGQSNYTTKEHAIDSVVENVVIDVESADVEFKPSTDGKCRVVNYELSRMTHAVQVSGSTLHICLADNRSWYDYMLLNVGQLKVTVYLPEAAYNSISVDTDSGNVQIAPGITSRLVEVKTDTGDIHIDSLHCNKDSILESDTGDMELRNLVCDGRMDIESDTGDVTFYGCDAGQISVETDTGDITGTLLTMKAFRAFSDTGDVDVPANGSGGSCQLHSETGDIHIRLH